MILKSSSRYLKYRYAVGGAVQPAIIVQAETVTAADTEVLLYAADQPGYAGEDIRILSVTEIDLSAL
jgi:hypothetical protein